MKQYIAATTDELYEIAPLILEALGKTRVVCFDAPMGAGKTTTIKALCKTLGSDEVVNSPTFAIVNDYALPNGDSIYHFDLYRLKDIAEAYDMPYFECSSNDEIDEKLDAFLACREASLMVVNVDGEDKVK